VCGGSPLFSGFNSREEDDDMCGGSPLLHFAEFSYSVYKCYLSGRIHRRGDLYFNSRSPLSEPEFLGFSLVLFSFHSDVGEIHRSLLLKILSFSPL